MSKNKQKEYLPLSWCKGLSNALAKVLGEGFDPAIIREVLSVHTTRARAMQILKEHPKLDMLLNAVHPMVFLHEGEDKARREAFRDMDCISMAMMWGKSKQVYKLDKDFASELLKTDTITFTKDVFDFLPYKYMYIDLSDSPEICEAINGKGFFVTVEKVPKDWNKEEIIAKKKNGELCTEVENLEDMDRWSVHICKVDEELYYHDLMMFPNEEITVQTDEVIDESSVPIYSDTGYLGDRTFNPRVYRKVVAQTLIYLSSVKADIDESETTKDTYRKPAVGVKPKHKFSEIRQWDVGVRFGTAFRKWSKEHNDTSHTATGTGSAKRPHTRRAHWHRYWYNDKERGKVLRPLWVAETFVGLNGKDPKDNPAVIHKTS